MSNSFFLNEHLLWPTIIGAVLLWAIFVFKEWPSKSTKRFWLKTGIGFLAVSALALIFLKPVITSEKTTKKGVLLTEGFSQEALDSLKKLNKNIEILNYKKGAPILVEDKPVSSLTILGEGVQDYDFWQLEKIPVTYVSRDPISGITKLNYNKENIIGDRFKLQGKYDYPINGNVIILEAEGGRAVDSVELNSDVNQIFKLSTQLKVAGKYIYRLTEKDSTGKTINSEPIPIIIRNKTPLKVLMIDAFPTFETKYLKNYLAETGNEVLVRSQITTGRYKYEYFNMERKQVVSFSEETLKEFDLVVIDVNSLNSLSKNETNTLVKIIKEDGLGVFIQPSIAFFNARNNFGSLKFENNNQTEFSFNSNIKLKINKYPFQLQDESDLQTIFSSEELKITGYKKIGKGRVGTSVMENTYQLVLDGNENEYQNLWSQIIEKISKRTKPTAEFETKQQFVFRDAPFNFKLRSRDSVPTVRNLDGTLISLIQDLDNANIWRGVNYPREKGWQQLQLENDSTAILDFYVHDAEVWKSLISVNTTKKNKQNFNGLGKKELVQKQEKPINPLWFFGLFLLCMGYLWLEPKLFQD